MGPRRATLAAGGMALGTGVAVFLLASTVFSHHSINHDEGVYLFQAAMLLDGKLAWQLGALADAFRPWFFVADGGRLYPRYSPVPGGVFSIGMALGEARLSLGAVAAGNVFLTFLIGRQVFDARVGLVAAALFAASPLALVSSAVFLPYASTTLFHLCFALCYLYAVEHESRRWALAAGVAIGIAFFARPFTAVLFALPFVAHALLAVVRALRDDQISTLVQHSITAVGGLMGVATSLAYNARMTGDPLTFPYQAFAPRDGPGFGSRRLLGHGIEYTPELAVRANLAVIELFVSDWFAAGWVGSALAGVGVIVGAVRWAREQPIGNDRLPNWPLAGLLLTIPAGNLMFWGNFNILGTFANPADGMIGLLGPFYHFDLLLPLSLFGAVGVVASWNDLTRRVATDGRTGISVAMATGLVLAGIVGGGMAVAAVGEPVDRNLEYANTFHPVYEPIDNETFDRDLVFVPRPYGNWLHHPFQYLRNDPSFDAPAVYALDRHVASDFAVIDAFPERTPHRFTYRGSWPPGDEPVNPHLVELSHESAEGFAVNTTVGVPDHVDHAMVELRTIDGNSVEYTVDDPGGALSVPWSLDAETTTLGSEPPMALHDHDRVTVLITLVQPDGGTLTYRLEADVRTSGATVEVLWPPERTVCPLVTDCGREGTYLPDRNDVHQDGVWMESSMEADDGS